MAEPFIAEIIMFGGNFAPRTWAFCDGQLLAISSNTALFSLVGTVYGGDGRSTFGLPDIRGRVPVHPGNGPGLSSYRLGERGGAERVTLTRNEIPSHNHALNVHNEEGDLLTPGNVTFGASGEELIYSNESADATMRSNTIGNNGGGQSHNNLQPFIAVNYIIAMQGLYPSRN